MDKYYAGIGSRSTPKDILKFMTEISMFLCRRGYVLRSGGAEGADTAFEEGVADSPLKEIYLPWKGFQGNKSPLWHVGEGALEVAKKYHPSYSSLSSAGRLLMARNVYQVLGMDLSTPVDLVVCWTPGGKLIGGTAQAIRIAKDKSIPIFNLGKDKDIDRVKECLKTDQNFI
jgi:hypothetical protein